MLTGCPIKKGRGGEKEISAPSVQTQDLEKKGLRYYLKTRRGEGILPHKKKQGGRGVERTRRGGGKGGA